MSGGLTDSSVKSPWFQQNLKSAINLLQYARVQVVYTKSMYKFQEWKSWKIMTNLRKIFCRAGFLFPCAGADDKSAWLVPAPVLLLSANWRMSILISMTVHIKLPALILVWSNTMLFLYMPYIINSKHELWHINKTPHSASRNLRKMQYRITFLVTANQRPFKKLVMELSQQPNFCLYHQCMNRHH